MEFLGFKNFIQFPDLFSEQFYFPILQFFRKNVSDFFSGIQKIKNIVYLWKNLTYEPNFQQVRRYSCHNLPCPDDFAATESPEIIFPKNRLFLDSVPIGFYKIHSAY